MDISSFRTRNYRQRSKVTAEKLCEAVDADAEFLTDELLENMNSTPIGQLLKMIGRLPDVRDEKISVARQRISTGHYDLGNDLDEALDIVVEELMSEG